MEELLSTLSKVIIRSSTQSRIREHLFCLLSDCFQILTASNSKNSHIVRVILFYTISLPRSKINVKNRETILRITLRRARKNTQILVGKFRLVFARTYIYADDTRLNTYYYYYYSYEQYTSKNSIDNDLVT